MPTAFKMIKTNGIHLRVAVEGAGPLVLMVHGFPELWYSWRHQMAPIAAAGFTAAAIDVRGYGGSDKPYPVKAYSATAIAGDIAGIIDALGGGKAVLLGHDWGAPLVYNTAFLYADKVRAVAGLSVPCLFPPPVPPLPLLREVFKGRFFYQNYFQKEGIAEAEWEGDVRTGLRKFYYAISGDAPFGTYKVDKGEDEDLLTALPDPNPFPAWLTKADEDVYVEAFTASGFRGPISRYRCQDWDWHDLRAFAEQKLAQPALFIGGEKDLVRYMSPGRDAYDPKVAGERLADCRGIHIVPKAGHWVQQEAPEATNIPLLKFLREI